MLNVSIPHIYGFVHGIDEKNKKFPCIIHAVRSRAGKCLTFHVHLENGAHYSLVPINKLSWKKCKPLPIEQLQAWDCFSSDVEVVTYDHFEFRRVVHKSLGAGEYLMSFDWHDSQYSDSTIDFKQLHLIKLDSGHFCLAPNNHLLFQDKTFTGDLSWKNAPRLKRQPQSDYVSVEK